MFKIITHDSGCKTHTPKISLKVMFKKPLYEEWRHSYICLEGSNHTVTYLLIKSKPLSKEHLKRGVTSPLLTNKCKVGRFFKHKSFGEELYLKRKGVKHGNKEANTA